MTNKEYRDSEGISRSELSVLLDKTPLHFKYERENPEKETPSLLFGRAAHKMILEPQTFFNEFAIAPTVDRRTKQGKEEYNEFCQLNEGKGILSVDDYEVIRAMKKAVDEHPIASALLFDGDFEQSFFWTDHETGERCKVRPDCMNTHKGVSYIIDYKTTDSCSDGAFERSVRKYHYKFQAGMYREGVFQNTYRDYVFVFIAQEKSAPYAVRVYFCTDEFVNEGYDEFRYAIGLYHECKTKNEWPGYDDSILTEEGGE